MQNSRRPLRILHVEDDDLDAEALVRAVRKASLSVDLHRVTDGDEALRWLGCYTDAEPVLVLLDVRLPRCPGHIVLSRIRESPEWSRAVVFMLTSSDDPRDRDAAYAHHANGYLRKDNVGRNAEGLIQLLDTYQQHVELPRPPQRACVL